MSAIHNDPSTSGKQDDFERLLKESLNDLADEMKDESGVKLGRADCGCFVIHRSQHSINPQTIVISEN